MERSMNIVITGHVDHGKSTVVGRLLADTDSLPCGKLEQVKVQCEKNSRPFEYAFLIDALKDEQKQGITIDAARIFFQTKKRRYILLDAPGHVEFLKNMVTGASRADAALLVIDALEGISENTRRHATLLSWLGVEKLVILVNKMDLVDWAEPCFEKIRSEMGDFLQRLGLKALHFIPIAALDGDNIVKKRDGWYNGPNVLEALDGFLGSCDLSDLPFRMFVQDVYKFTRFGDSRRIIVGRVESGKLAGGQRISFWPSAKSTVVEKIQSFPPEKEKNQITVGESAGFTMTQQIYVQRGELCVLPDETKPFVSRSFRARIFWLSDQELSEGSSLVLKLCTQKTEVVITKIHSVLDTSLLQNTNSLTILKNQAAEVSFLAKFPLCFDLETEHPLTSRFVLCLDYRICGGGKILESLEDVQKQKELLRLQKRESHWEHGISRLQRASRYAQKPAMIVITGEKDSGKKPFARRLENLLFESGRYVYFLGIGNIIHGLGADLEGSSRHRREYVRRLGEVANLFLDSGQILLVTAINLTDEEMELLKIQVGANQVFSFWLSDPAKKSLSFDFLVEPRDSCEKAVRWMQEKGLIFDSGR